MPPNPSYKKKDEDIRISLGRNTERHLTLEKLAEKQTTARDIHGTMHATRVVLWSQLLRLIYQTNNSSVSANPVYLALTAALHDAARENEGTDYWDDESSELVFIQLRALGVPESEISIYKQAVSEKDPANFSFTTDIQALVHDSDCLDIMRIYGLEGFRSENLNIYRKEPEQKECLDEIISEVAEFIKLTETASVKTYMEHNSSDFFGDLVRLLFLLNERDKKFINITALLLPEMKSFLKTKENTVTKWLLNEISPVKTI